MTERMKKYRQKMEEKGMKYLRIWVSNEVVSFVKYISKFSKKGDEFFVEGFGRKASQNQIKFAEKIAKQNNKPSPTYLYDYHISLAGWIWAHGGRPFQTHSED